MKNNYIMVEIKGVKRMWIVILFVLAILVFLEVIRELHCFQVTEYVVESDKLTQVGRELCVLFLSDLHNHVYGKENEKLRKSNC